MHHRQKIGDLVEAHERWAEAAKRVRAAEPTLELRRPHEIPIVNDAAQQLLDFLRSPAGQAGMDLLCATRTRVVFGSKPASGNPAARESVVLSGDRLMLEVALGHGTPQFTPAAVGEAVAYYWLYGPGKGGGPESVVSWLHGKIDELRAQIA